MGVSLNKSYVGETGLLLSKHKVVRAANYYYYQNYTMTAILVVDWKNVRQSRTPSSTAIEAKGVVVVVGVGSNSNNDHPPVLPPVPSNNSLHSPPHLETMHHYSHFSCAGPS